MGLRRQDKTGQVGFSVNNQSLNLSLPKPRSPQFFTDQQVASLIVFLSSSDNCQFKLTSCNPSASLLQQVLLLNLDLAFVLYAVLNT
jgi:hypothetical protein